MEMREEETVSMTRVYVVRAELYDTGDFIDYSETKIVASIREARDWLDKLRSRPCVKLCNYAIQIGWKEGE